MPGDSGALEMCTKPSRCSALDSSFAVDTMDRVHSDGGMTGMSGPGAGVCAKPVAAAVEPRARWEKSMPPPMPFGKPDEAFGAMGATVQFFAMPTSLWDISEQSTLATRSVENALLTAIGNDPECTCRQWRSQSRRVVLSCAPDAGRAGRSKFPKPSFSSSLGAVSLCFPSSNATFPEVVRSVCWPLSVQYTHSLMGSATSHTRAPLLVVKLL